ncbi:MAG: outer membrane beta-barrel protein [Deltaproteobacteria bacterium]|nr:outer membrane beta-barrel protein [Deltaproteobacteria bacterium]
MTKKALLPLLLLLSVLFHSIPAAAGSAYVFFNLGASPQKFEADKLDFASGGTQSLKKDNTLSDTGVLLGLGLGVDLKKTSSNLPLRLDVAYNYRSGGYEKRVDNLFNYKVTSLSTLLLNCNFDLPLGSSVKPYIGLGLGLGFIGYKTNGSYYYNRPGYSAYVKSESEGISSAFAYRLGLGAAYDLSERLTVDLGYSYNGTGEFTTLLLKESGLVREVNVKGKASMHDFVLSLRINV